jgi:hypothetical protein
MKRAAGGRKVKKGDTRRSRHVQRWDRCPAQRNIAQPDNETISAPDLYVVAVQKLLSLGNCLLIVTAD